MLTPVLQNHDQPTKRQISSDVAKTFDVLGWFAPPIIMSKILLQQLWQLQLNRDEPVPLELAREWEVWKKQIPLLTDHPIPHCYFDPNKEKIFLYNCMVL